MSATSDSAERWAAPPMVTASIGVHALALGTAALVPEAAWWALGGIGLNQLGLTAAGCWPRSSLLGPNLTQLPADARARRAYALTLDDGPDPGVTPRVLDLLDQHGVRASFFCIAQRAREHAALAREIVARGHCVQNHSLVHRHNFALLGPQALAREIGQAQAVLADVTGTAPHCFRAPAGLRNPFLDLVLHRLGLQLVSWTRRGYDTVSRDPQRVLRRLTRELGPGDILLLHDGNARHTSEGRAVVLDVLPALLEACRTAGLRPETLSQAVPARRGAART